MTPLSHLLAAFRVAAFICWLLVCVPIQIVVMTLGLRIQHTLPVIFHIFLTRFILGMKVEKAGTISPVTPTLYLSNHISYLDTVGIASIIPTNFVAKAEVADWPLFGYLAKLQGTVFVDRTAKKATAQQGDAMVSVIREKRNIVLYPEGTSTDGSHVKPFKSGLLQAILDINDMDVMVQPVSVACFGKHGQQYRYAWYGDMTLLPHLWKIFGTYGLTLRFTFHEAFKASRFADRKQLADFAQSEVQKGPFGPHDMAEIKSTLPQSVSLG